MTDAWMTMIFRHGFFHGDPHPANILLLDDGRIGLVDFGLAGRLTDEDMTRLTRLFIDAATENVAALPRRLSELGVRYPKEREDELRAAIEELYYRYYGSSLSEIDPIEVIREGLDLIYSLNLRLPTRFMMLDKAIATLGAVGVELYPEFNVFEVARPYARGLLAERFSPRRMSLRAQSEVRELAGIARELPYQMRDVLEQTRQGRLEVQIRNPGFDDLSYHIDHAVNRLAVALIVLGGLVGSSIVGVLAKDGPHVVGLHLLSFIGFMLSGVFARLAHLGDRPLRAGCSAASLIRRSRRAAAQQLQHRLVRQRPDERAPLGRSCPPPPRAHSGRPPPSPRPPLRTARRARSGRRRSTRARGADPPHDPRRRECEEDLAAAVVRDRPVRARPSPARRASAPSCAGPSGASVATTAMQLPAGGRGPSPSPTAGNTGTPSIAESRAAPKFASTSTPDRRVDLGDDAARGADPALPAESDHARACADATLGDGPGGARLRGAAGVRGVDLHSARVVEPAVVALADDRDDDVVDADSGSAAQATRPRRRRHGRPPSSRSGRRASRASPTRRPGGTRSARPRR